eukprot:2814246-Prymnesium_polylepis.1
MASFCRSAALHREWSVEDAARFAARKEFELLQLLSTPTRRPWRRRVDSASLFSDRRSRRRKRNIL